MTKPKDHPLMECAAVADRLIKEGCQVYQKWTCEKCGDRVTANNANVFTTEGHHEECGHITNLLKTGCNYMVIASNARAQKALLKYKSE